MNTLKIAFAFATCALLAPVAHADNKGKKPAAADAKKMEQMEMQMMQQAATPGPMHKWLEAHNVGTWSGQVKMWMAPGAKPMESTATNETKSILGGRYLVDESTGSMMGKPFEGRGMTGYDNMTKKFWMTWVDNFGTGVMVSYGTLDEKTNTLTMTASVYDPMTKKDMPVKTVVKYESDKKHTMEMYGLGPDGKEVKMMEIVYTKK